MTEQSGAAEVAAPRPQHNHGTRWPGCPACELDATRPSGDEALRDRFKANLLRWNPDLPVSLILAEFDRAALATPSSAPDMEGLPTVDEMRAALHEQGIGCKPNVPYCHATHRGHAERLVASLAALRDSRS